MKFATKIDEVLKAFSPEALLENNIEEFYYDGTMTSRLGDDEGVSPIDDIYDSCTSMPKSAYLLLGHRGCGKTTELKMLKKRLKENGYLVEDISVSTDMDMMSPAVWDLLVLIAEKLLNIANEINCRIDDSTLNSLKNFFDEEEVIKEFVKEKSGSFEVGASAGGLLRIINLFGKLSGEVKVGGTTKTVIRKAVEKKGASVWISYVNKIADAIAEKSEGKRPVLIVEDFDKADPALVRDLFYGYATTLSSMSFHIVYTFPISLSYHADFTSITGYFSYKTLPMIKIKYPNGGKYTDGTAAIEEIIKKRALIDLFADGVIELIIKKTGGALRDLFGVIINAGKRANRRKSNVIEIEDAERALIELKSELTRKIDGDDYPFLINIINAKNKQKTDNREHLLRMMQALVVLEYNGDHWHDVHPLVSDFLMEESVMDEKKTN